MLGISQEKLGGELGVSFQQIQKYERGTNRIGSSRLFEISKVLGVAPNYFFEQFEGQAVPGMAESGESSVFETAAVDKEAQQLLRAYYTIKDPKVRKRVLDLVRTMAEQG